MNYLQALKTARDYFGMDAVAIQGEDIIPLSELIEQAETAPVVSGSSDVEVRLDTGGQLTTAAGNQIPAWAVSQAPEGEQSSSPQADSEPLLIVVSGKDLPG